MPRSRIESSQYLYSRITGVQALIQITEIYLDAKAVLCKKQHEWIFTRNNAR